MKLSLQISKPEEKIREYLEKNGWVCIMPLKVVGSSFTKGVSDIIAFKKGILLAIEIKKTYKLSKPQEQFKMAVENNGGVYIMKNFDEIISEISKIDYEMECHL